MPPSRPHTPSAAQALAALRALCAQGLAPEALVPAVLEALHSVVPSYRNLFDWTDAEGRLLRYVIEGPIDPTLAQLYFDEFHNRREAEAMPPFQALRHQPAGVRGAEDLDPAGFYRSALYHEIWRPQGFHTRLEAVLRGRGDALLGSLVLYRAPGDPPFSATDRQRLASLLPALAQALEHAGPPDDDAPHLPGPEPAETLLLTPDGQLRHASTGALRLLLMASGGASRDALSRPLLDLGAPLVPQVLAGLRAGLPPGQPAGSCRPAPGLGGPAQAAAVSLRTPAGRFVATGQWLHALAPGGEPLVQLSLRRLEPLRVALERALRRLPLTPGQVAVCRALYQGQPQADIARQLGVAPTTVIDHVRKAYRALDLHSVPDLRSLLDTRMAQAAG